MLRVQRSLHSYYDTQLATANPRTVCTTKYAMKNFQAFLKKYHSITPDEAAVVFTDEQIFYDVTQAWINDNSKKMAAKTVKLYFQLVKPFFIYRGLKFHPIDIRQNLKFPKVLYIEKHGITREEIKILLDILKPRHKAYVLCQSSSGMRVGELLRMRRKQLDLSTKRITVTIPAEHSKNGREGMTFFSKEAAKYLIPIIRNLDDNDLVFTKNEDWESARNTVLANMRRWTAKTGLTNITTHSFRAYFITKVSRIDPNLAKRLATQGTYLDSYDRLSKADKLEKYLEFEPHLLIEEDYRLKAENSLLEQKVLEIETIKATHEKVNQIFGAKLSEIMEAMKESKMEMIENKIRMAKLELAS